MRVARFSWRGLRRCGGGGHFASLAGGFASFPTASPSLSPCGGGRRFSTSSSTGVAAPASAQLSSSPVVELREYQLHPEHSVSYMRLTGAAADVRRRLVPLRFFSVPETGGPMLHVATHAYYYQGGMEERESRRAAMGSDPDWKEYLQKCRPCMASQSSTLWVEAPLVDRFRLLGLRAEADDDKSLDSTTGADSVLELRRYQLKLGYESVPTFLDLYEAGLPFKLNAEGTDPSSELVTVLSSDVGPMNHVLEVWRHRGGVAAMSRSREAARAAPEWRRAIAGIADLAVSFTTAIHRPAAFSPLR